MRRQIFGACCLPLIVCGCASGPRDFSLSSVQLVEFADQPPPLQFQLKVKFTTSTNLSRVKQRGYVLASRGYVCDRPDDYVILTSGGLYFRDQPVSADVEVVNPNISGPLIYSTYVGVARRGLVPSKPREISYNMKLNPEDVCLYIAGGNASPFGFRSNTIRVPKELISTALQSLSPEKVDF